MIYVINIKFDFKLIGLRAKAVASLVELVNFINIRRYKIFN